MKKITTILFEPFWFILIFIVSAIKYGDREFRNTLNCTGTSKLKLLRYASKKLSRLMPYMLPNVIWFGFLIGVLVGNGFMSGLLGALYFYGILALVPILMPMPSTFVNKV